MKYLAILDPVLDALHDGRIFRRIFGFVLKAIAGLVVLGTLLTLVTALGLAFGSSMALEARIGVLLFAAAIVAMAVLQVNVLLYHARGVERLPPTAVVLSSIMFSMVRMLGECYAIFMCGVGVGGFLASLFGAGAVVNQTGFGAVPGMGLVGGTGSGAVLLIMALLLAFVGLTLSYFIAQQGALLGDIATSLRKLVPYSTGIGATPAPMPIPPSVFAAPRGTPVPAPASPTPTASIPRPTPAPIPPPPAPPPPVARPVTPPPASASPFAAPPFAAPPAAAPPAAPPVAPPPAAARPLPAPAARPQTPPPATTLPPAATPTPTARMAAPAPETPNRRCRNCNAFLGPEQLFCIECGTRVA